MSYFVGEVPEVVVKPGKMILQLTTSKMKAILAGIILILYVYLLIYFKTIYLTNKRLDEIMAKAIKTERELVNVHNLDKKLAIQMAQLDRVYGHF